MLTEMKTQCNQRNVDNFLLDSDSSMNIMKLVISPTV